MKNTTRALQNLSRLLLRLFQKRAWLTRSSCYCHLVEWFEGFGDSVFEPLLERYLVDKNNGKLRQYWNDRKLVQEEEKTNKAAAIQTSISINRATTRVIQSADKQVESRRNKADESSLPYRRKHLRDPLESSKELPKTPRKRCKTKNEFEGLCDISCW
ncbi:hypothetical protein EDD11_000709, partial [Mortierella claussenii]